jgi:hypothetical protein
MKKRTNGWGTPCFRTDVDRFRDTDIEFYDTNPNLVGRASGKTNPKEGTIRRTVRENGLATWRALPDGVL